MYIVLKVLPLLCFSSWKRIALTLVSVPKNFKSFTVPPIGYIDIFWAISTVDICRYLLMVVAFFKKCRFGCRFQSVFLGKCRYWTSIFVEICQYVSKNVHICDDFGRYLSIYVDICRKMSISVSIRVDICRKMSISVSISVDVCRKMSISVSI